MHTGTGLQIDELPSFVNNSGIIISIDGQSAAVAEWQVDSSALVFELLGQGWLKGASCASRSGRLIAPMTCERSSQPRAKEFEMF